MFFGVCNQKQECSLENHFIGKAAVFVFFLPNCKRTSIATYKITKVPSRANQTAHAATGATARKRPRVMLMRARIRPIRPTFLWNISQINRPVVLVPSGCLWGRLKTNIHKLMKKQRALSNIRKNLIGYGCSTVIYPLIKHNHAHASFENVKNILKFVTLKFWLQYTLKRSTETILIVLVFYERQTKRLRLVG